MFPSPKKKSDLSVMLGMKKPAPRDEGPPPFGQSEEQEMESAVEESAEGGLTPDMLGYHSGAENCGACVHFTEPSTCDRFSEPVEASGYCRGFQGGMSEEVAEMPLETEEVA